MNDKEKAFWVKELDPMDFCGELCNFAEELIEKAKAKWIPVTERMPEDTLPRFSEVKQIKVLTVLKSSSGVRTVRSQMRYRDTWAKETRWMWRCSASDITHWMPLPELPKEEDNG